MKPKKDQPDLKLQLFRRAWELGELMPVPENPRDEAQRQLYHERVQQYGDKRSAYMTVIRDLGLFEEYIKWAVLWEHHE
jgi:hypothetical protein